MSRSGSNPSDVCVTSSTMPTVKWLRGFSLESSSKTPAIMAGVNSFDDRPYRPPTIRGRAAPSRASANAVTTSW